MTKSEDSHIKTYVVEHLDPELGPWSALEYLSIAEESKTVGANFCLSSVPESLVLPEALRTFSGLSVERRSVEEIYESSKPRICLLDPAATTELSVRDGEHFDIFLFGGILGKDRPEARHTVL